MTSPRGRRTDETTETRPVAGRVGSTFPRSSRRPVGQPFRQYRTTGIAADHQPGTARRRFADLDG
ncbi:MAG: hypothetical protein ACT4NY_17385 [Pseudonocardiales bacterium]